MQHLAAVEVEERETDLHEPIDDLLLGHRRPSQLFYIYRQVPACAELCHDTQRAAIHFKALMVRDDGRVREGGEELTLAPCRHRLHLTQTSEAQLLDDDELLCRHVARKHRDAKAALPNLLYQHVITDDLRRRRGRGRGRRRGRGRWWCRGGHGQQADEK